MKKRLRKERVTEIATIVRMTLKNIVGLEILSNYLFCLLLYRVLNSGPSP
jgi:hypothetical protein